MTYELPFSRRAFLASYAGSLGPLALAYLVAQGNLRADSENRLARSSMAGGGKAKSVICLFQHGGPSQMDLFDPKPELTKWHGKPYPGGNLEIHFDKQAGNVLGSPYAFKKYGACGMEMSELLPHTGGIADEITLVRSMSTESVDHESALRLIHSGKFLAGMPSLGSWVVYAMGSENANLPAYVVLSDPGGLPVDGDKNWTSGWLPAVYQGTMFRSGGSPVLNLAPPEGALPAARRRQLELLAEFNRKHIERHPGNSELAARIANVETAARMQLAVPDVVDLSQETEETRKMYGLDQTATKE